ncbi:uncharacterized protein LOC124402342 isoform X2 [Silurus meridionalis]|uniref:uncharacterized protein LOC124402342 isoform X2 n=1 Tax=Silurus meridionalis TaxID=175797 RepID=UPI001EEB4CA1|nr:uncharacterized protein LOC124402342 isoform X2 [Silurus meridionalis]
MNDTTIVITILLMIILLRNFCKLNTKNSPDSNIEGGTFRMSECMSDQDNPSNTINKHSNKIQIHTACSDDLSSTSSESSCDLHEDKKDSVNDSNHQQYMTTIQTANYENIPEGKLPSALEIKNKMAKKNRDYVNIEEQHNMPLTKGRISKTKRHQIDQDESQTSSESSSDESDEVNYTTVVFKKVTNEELKEN